MHLRRRIELRDEEGTTLVELLVGMGMGMVVLAGLAMVMIVTLHGNARVDARVEATDNARVVMTRIIEELHSACVKPMATPVKEGSTRNTLIHAWDLWPYHDRHPGREPDGNSYRNYVLRTFKNAYAAGRLIRTDHSFVKRESTLYARTGFFVLEVQQWLCHQTATNRTRKRSQ
jgi:Tfp pilus assembly protein PilW